MATGGDRLDNPRSGIENRLAKLEENVDGRLVLLQRMRGFSLALIVALLFLAPRQ